MRTVTALVILIAAFGNASATRGDNKAACAQVKEKIRTVESQLRAGYTRQKGERLEARLRELKTQRKYLCK